MFHTETQLKGSLRGGHHITCVRETPQKNVEQSLQCLHWWVQELVYVDIQRFSHLVWYMSGREIISLKTTYCYSLHFKI